MDEEDRRFFLEAVAEVCAQTGWRVHAWVMLGNHYHLLIETPEANLVEGMKWLQNTYTRRFNVRHRAWGRVFGDRYKCVVVEGELPEYYGSLVDYIHLNPARAGIVSALLWRATTDIRTAACARRCLTLSPLPERASPRAQRPVGDQRSGRHRKQLP